MIIIQLLTLHIDILQLSATAETLNTSSYCEQQNYYLLYELSFIVISICLPPFYEYTQYLYVYHNYHEHCYKSIFT